jgi:GNAT superfamily N-acetyltransferase
MSQVLKFDSKEIDIRQARETDAGALARLVSELGYPTDEAVARERLTDISRAGDRVLVALLNSEVVGMVLLHRTRFIHRPADGRISTLVVSESCQGHGIGSRLIESAEAVFREWGCARVEVSSGAQRAAAHRFYERLGYAEQPKRFVKALE